MRLFRRRYGIILLYHRIAEPDDDPHGLCVSPAHFAQHLQVLGAVIDLDELVGGRRGTAITFDDGYADNLTVAKPLLERHAAPATVFVATGYLGGDFSWDGGRALAADDVAALAGGGLVTVGAHTVTHPVLATRPAAEQRDELEVSKARLEELTGRPVERFAYPYGSGPDYTPDTVRLVRDAGFRSACANFPGWVGARTPRFELPRYLVRDWPGDELERRLRGWLR